MSEYEKRIKQARNLTSSLRRAYIKPFTAEQMAAKEYSILDPQSGIPDLEAIAESFGLTHDMLDDLISMSRLPYDRAEHFPKRGSRLTPHSQRRTASGGEQ